jgi:hypothetical protein
MRTRRRLTSPWQPLTLCWRRRASRAGTMVVRAAPTHVHHHLHLQTNAHLSVQLFHRDRSRATTSDLSTPLRRARLDVPMPATTRRLILQRHTHVANERTNVRTQASTHRELIRLPGTERTLSVAPDHVSPADLPHSRARQLLPRAADTVLPRSTSAQRHIGRPAQLHRVTRIAKSEHAPVQVERVRYHQPPPSLVWRRPESPEAQQETSSLASPAKPATRSATETHVKRNVAAAAPSAMHPSVREAVRSTPIDSAAADRLADDVMRRLEKRFRIERERRGL